MQRMTLLSHGMHIVVEPFPPPINDCRICWGNIDIGVLKDDDRAGTCDVVCLSDARFGALTFGRQEQRIASAVDRLIGHLMKLAADRHTPPVVETVEDDTDA